MSNFKNLLLENLRPENSELFDLSCEYIIMLLDKIEADYNGVVETAEKITEKYDKSTVELYQDCFWNVEAFIDYYSKLVKAIKLSIGQNVGRVKSSEKIFDSKNYNQNDALQISVIHGLRNTSQHFEERLQNYKNELNPFLKLSYVDSDIKWEIKFGKGGYSNVGNKRNNKKNVFDIGKLFFHSYQKVGEKIVPITISIKDLWNDVSEIFKLVNENMIQKRKDKNSKGPNPVRNLSIFEIPDK